MSSPACADGYDTPAQKREDSTTFMVAKVRSTDIRSRKRSRRQAGQQMRMSRSVDPQPRAGSCDISSPREGTKRHVLPLPPPRRLLLSCAGADCVRPERPRAGACARTPPPLRRRLLFAAVGCMSHYASPCWFVARVRVTRAAGTEAATFKPGETVPEQSWN